MKRITNINRWHRMVLIFGAVAWSMLLTATAMAAVPKLINFQGILKDGSGNPVANGSYFASFRIYDVPAGGTVLWGDTQTVVTSSGLFNAVLGRGTPVPDTVFNDSVLYLGIQVFPDPEMTPRQRLTTSGYSFRSEEWVSVGNNLYHLNGNVGIGTTTPAAKLHVSKAAGEGLPSLTNTTLVVNNNAAATDVASISVIGGSAGGSQITFGDNSAASAGSIAYEHTTDRLRFGAGGIGGLVTLHGSTGFLAVGSVIPTTRLHVMQPGTVADVATFDRFLNDGVIIRLAQDGITEGTISVSGTTISYNAFTGSHYGWTEEKLERGELVSLTGINRNSHDNPKSEVIYGIKRSTVPNDPACLGSYLGLQGSSQPYSSDNPHLVMAVGNGEMWVVDAGQNIQPGDYLISSDISGHAMKDDEAKYLIGHIVARAAEGVDWSTVSEMVGGKKHKKISVLFGNFVRTSVASVNQLLERQQQQIERLEKKLEEMQSEKPQAKVE